MTAKLVGINHVALEVSDLERSLDFYGRLFEVRLRSRSTGAAFVDIGDQFIALMQGRSQPPDGARRMQAPNWSDAARAQEPPPARAMSRQPPVAARRS